MEKSTCSSFNIVVNIVVEMVDFNVENIKPA